ncbi:MAG: hypothetical protein E7581_06935 [Ruminococcaceae bacterium]|nr:hypothetical protein [Oscillospiraceae bacterium]
MDILYTVLAVTVSLLSVFGLWCAVKFPIEAFFSSGKVVAAIELTNEKDAEMLDVLLHEAHSAFFRKGMRRIIVLIDVSLVHGCLGTEGIPDEKTLELLARYGADYRIMS